MTNTLGFILCLAYILTILGVAELLRRRRGYDSGFTRKVIHIGVGMMIWLVPFSSPPPGRSSWPASCS